MSAILTIDDVKGDMKNILSFRDNVALVKLKKQLIEIAPEDIYICPPETDDNQSKEEQK